MNGCLKCEVKKINGSWSGIWTDELCISKILPTAQPPWDILLMDFSVGGAIVFASEITDGAPEDLFSRLNGAPAPGSDYSFYLTSPPLQLLHPPAALLLLPLPPLLQLLAVGPAGQLASHTFLEGERCPAEEQELPPPVESPVVLLNDHDALQQPPVLLPVCTTAATNQHDQ